MVKRGGKEIVTVNIYKENYEILKKKAYSKRYTAEEYINSLLSINIEKDAFLARYAPHLSLDSMQEPNLIMLMDTDKRGLVDVRVIDGELHCDDHKTTDCVHTHFVWAMPEVAKLNIKRPPTAPEH